MANEQIEHLSESLWNVIDRFRKEYDLCTAEAVGVLESMKFSLLMEAHEDSEEQE